MTVPNEKTVKYKLVIGFLLVIVLFVSFGVISLWEVHTLGKLTKMIYEHPLVVSNAALNAGINMTKMHRSMKDVALSNSLNELDKASNEVNRYEQSVYEQLDVIKEMIIGTEGQNLEKRTRQLFADWKPMREEVFLLFHSGRRDEAAAITKGKGADHVAKLEDKMILKWAESHEHISELAGRVHSVDLNQLLEGLERLIRIHLGSRGLK